jgi:hypothetical protein
MKVCHKITFVYMLKKMNKIHFFYYNLISLGFQLNTLLQRAELLGKGFYLFLKLIFNYKNYKLKLTLKNYRIKA